MIAINTSLMSLWIMEAFSVTLLQWRREGGQGAIAPGHQKPSRRHCVSVNGILSENTLSIDEVCIDSTA
jgi:hypothetical protein